MQQATAGAQGDTFPVPALTCTHGTANPTPANARLTIQADGDVERVQGAGVTDIGDWISPKINMALYECRLTPISGTLSVGNVNVFEALNVDVQYGVQQAVIGSKAFSGTWELRRIGGSLILASIALSMTATVS
jgi:hypothetical protein